MNLNTPRVQKPKNSNKMSFYYYNDTHGNTDPMAGILTTAKLYKQKMKDSDITHFVVSAGDNCAGVNVKKNDFFFGLMQNIMGVDVSAVGNHECDAGARGFFEAASTKNIPFIATNAKFSADNPMGRLVKKSVIKEQNGQKVGFVGTMPIDLKYVLKKEALNGIEVSDDINVTIKLVQDEINNLKAQGVDKIVMLSHVGYETDKILAQNLDGVDVIIGGHTHVLVEGAKQGENVVYSKSGEPVIITQALENANYYGILDVEFNDNGQLTKVNNQVIQSPNMTKSPVIEALKTSILGPSPQVGKIDEIDPAPKNRKNVSHPWTAFVCDAIRDDLGTQIAVINNANIRKFPQTGSLTEDDIMESTPMGNKLLKTKITQKQLVEGIKSAAKRTMTSGKDCYPGLIQVSGLTYKIDDTGELLEMNFIDEKGNINPIDINNPSDKITYTAAYDSFVADKDKEYPEFAPQFPVENLDYDKNVSIKKYIAKLENKDNLVIKDDHRLEIIKTDKPKQPGNSTRKFLSLTSSTAA